MMRSSKSKRGQGTLEYVIIFALIAVVLLVVGFLLRKQLQALGKSVVEKLDWHAKEPPPTTDGTDAGPPLDPEENPYLKKKDQKDQKGGVGHGPGGEKEEKGKQATVERPPPPPDPEPEDPKWSLADLPIGKRVIMIGAAVAITIALFFYFSQGRKT